MSIEAVHTLIETKKEAYLEYLKTLLAQPSISTRNIGIQECSGLLKSMMEEIGIKTTIFQTAGHPIIYGELLADSPDAPTILFYGHYDVQPPDPVELWLSPPFEPTIRDGRLFARGVADNKGQLMTHLLAVRAYLAIEGSLPANVKFLFEGEEECGSPNIEQFVYTHREMLKTDLAYPADGAMHNGDVPYVRFGCRGLITLEIQLETSEHENHSGTFGGVVPNAAWELVRLLSSMKDNADHVTVEGFYDDVLPPSKTDLELIDKLSFDSEEIARVVGLSSLGLEKKEYFNRLMFQPTMSINGIKSGYTEEGSKTITPNTAVAKMDIRLVNNQDPIDIFQKIKNHIERYAPKAKVICGHYMLPSKTSLDLPICRTIVAALRKVYGKEPIQVPVMGASLPNYVFTNCLGAPALNIPYGNIDSYVHSPNENLKLDLIYKGIHATAQVIHDVGKMRK